MEYKKITEVEELEEINENTNLLVEDNGEVKRVAASKVAKESGGSGGIRIFNIEFLNTEDIYDYFIIHGATLNDVKNVFYLNGIDPEDTDCTFTTLYVYNEYDGDSILRSLDKAELAPDHFYIDGEYLDGVKVHKVVNPG